MTDAAQGESIFRLIYRSHSVIEPDQRSTALGEIFTTARRNNRRLNITGALVTSGDAFAQALEGDEEAVRGLYATIERDPRHHDVSLVEQQTVAGRVFGRWAMARVSEDGGADIRLMSNASKGVIVEVAGGDQHVTPEQETVLASMRSSIVGTLGV